jgi:hypothetical protein
LKSWNLRGSSPPPDKHLPKHCTPPARCLCEQGHIQRAQGECHATTNKRHLNTIRAQATCPVRHVGSRLRPGPLSDQGAPQNRASAQSPVIKRYRHTLPVRLSLGGCSFQFGRTSILLPRPPHLAHTTRERNHGTSVSTWKDPFPRSSSDRSSLPRSIKHPRLEHYNRDDDHAARDDEPVRIDWHQ